jgi:phosphate-selective porin OprO/OprP
MRFLYLLFLFTITSYSFSQDITSNTFGKGISILARDSSFSLKFGARFQTLYEAAYTEDSKNYAEQLSIRRWRLKFDGYVYNPKLVYKIEIGLSNRDIGDQQPRIILDAVLKYHFNKNWTLWFGQTKLPGNRERVISSQKLQFVDRSNVNARFNLDRDVGIQLHHEDMVGNGIFKQILSISMGEGRNPTSPNVGGYNYTGRLEYLPFGEFTSNGDYFGSDLKREATPKLSIGATYDYNDGASRSRGQLGSDVLGAQNNLINNNLSTVIVDAMFKLKGLSIMSEYIDRQGEDNIAGFGTGTGFVAQAGYLFKNNFEIAGRFSTIKPDDLNYSAINEEKEYTLGLSRYIVGHSLKVQTDFSYDDFPLAENQFKFRFQIELAF